MNERERLEARYDVMPADAAERVYGDPLARRLAEHKGQAALMERLIREAIGTIRLHPSSPLTDARRTDISGMWQHRRKLQANASLCQVLIAHRKAQRSLMGAAV